MEEDIQSHMIKKYIKLQKRKMVSLHFKVSNKPYFTFLYCGGYVHYTENVAG